MTWTVQRLQYARLNPVQPAPVGWTPEGEVFDLPVYGYLLRRGSDAVLYDLAPPQLRKAHRDGHLALAGAPIAPRDAVLQAGCDPEQISSVVLSHLHWDHAHGVEGFPNAKVLVQEAELRAAQDPPAGHAGAYDNLQWLWTERHRVTALAGAAVLAPGLSVLPTPGHTPGSQTLLAETPHGTVGLAGDLVHRYENILGPANDGEPVPPGLRSSAECWRQSLAALSRLACILLLAHDERGEEVLTVGARLAAHDPGFAFVTANGKRITDARDLTSGPSPRFERTPL